MYLEFWAENFSNIAKGRKNTVCIGSNNAFRIMG